MREAPVTRSILRAAAFALVTSALALGSCSQETKTPGQLVVAVSTDMALPDQVDTIQIQVSVGDRPLLDYPMPTGTGPDAQPIPATLTLVAGPDPSVAATIRVIGLRNGEARTLRKVVTTVPAQGTALLRMPVQWLCDGTTHAVKNADGGVTYESDCGADNSCQAGRCVPSRADPTKLPDYDAGAVFGGGAQPAAKGHSEGACFDTVGCMLAGQAEAPDDQCTVELPAGNAENVNVALRVANDGICDTTKTQCFVPLDGKSTEGWTVQDGRIALPPAVCTKLRNGLVTAVQVSTGCATKLDSTPPCGPWSSVRFSPDAALPPSTVDAAALGVPTLVASVVDPKSDGTTCCPLMADSQALYTCTCAGNTVSISSIDPATGTTAQVTSFTTTARDQYATVLAGGDVYWVSRSQNAVPATCSFNRTPVAGGPTSAGLAVVAADVYDNSDLLADATNLYVLADNVSGLAPGASAVQLLRVDRMSGTVTPFDTSGARPSLQFTQDPKSVYVTVDTDVAAGDASFERISRVVALPKAGGSSVTLLQQTLTIANLFRGGFVGLQDDGSSLFALYEGPTKADGTIDVELEKIGKSPGDKPTRLYGEAVIPASVQYRLLGAVSGAVVLARDTTQVSDAGTAAQESSVLVIPADGSTPRTIASFKGDAPAFELQVPTFTSDVFWLNKSGRIFRLSASALR